MKYFLNIHNVKAKTTYFYTAYIYLHYYFFFNLVVNK